jgi:hypothetical protein
LTEHALNCLVAEQAQEKKLKVLALIANQRSPLLPDVQPTTELGFPAVDVVPWYGLAVNPPRRSSLHCTSHPCAAIAAMPSR